MPSSKKVPDVSSIKATLKAAKSVTKTLKTITPENVKTKGSALKKIVDDKGKVKAIGKTATSSIEVLIKAIAAKRDCMSKCAKLVNVMEKKVAKLENRLQKAVESANKSVKVAKKVPKQRGGNDAEWMSAFFGEQTGGSAVQDLIL